MRKNVGKSDRNIRMALGVALLVIGLVAGTWWGLIGLVPLVTGLAGTCPVYSLLRISTRRDESVRFGGGAL